jgi:hypothetical protein
VFHDWEVDVIALFFGVLYLVRMRLEGEGKLWWVPPKRELFGVKSFYSIMSCNDDFCFPWKSGWWTKVPLRAAFFVWSAALGNIIIIDNFQTRHVIVVGRYCMCKKNRESMDHLLLCEVACAINNVFSSHFGLSWVMPR